MSKEDFYELTPERVLKGVEAAGYVTTGRLLQLNSYENRVFEVSLEKEVPEIGDKIIVKFYRPGRWSQETILEEHSFLQDLKNNDIPAVAPLRQVSGETLSQFDKMWVATFPKAKGRLTQEFNDSEIRRLGRTLAELHNIGASSKFKHRPTMNPSKTINETLKLIDPWLPPDLEQSYHATAKAVENFLESHLDKNKFVRIQGDCHKGNILETDPINGRKEYFMIDFDDCMMGPVAQDFWMLFSGDEAESEPELEALLAGYLELRELDPTDLEIIPGLRALRILYYAGWIAKRWEDPTFPKLFPQFEEHNYWREELDTLQGIITNLGL